MNIFKIFNIIQFFIAYQNISIKQILYNILIFMFYKTLTMLEKVSNITIFREKSSPLMCDLIGVSSRFRTFYSHCEGKSRKIAEAHALPLTGVKGDFADHNPSRGEAES